ncbi:glycoside hydrolase family 20 protein [Porphyromonas sp.]
MKIQTSSLRRAAGIALGALGLLLLGAAPLTAAPADSLRLIPRPASITWGAGHAQLPTTLTVSPLLPQVIQTQLSQQAGIKVKATTKAPLLSVRLDRRLAGREAYRLSVGPRGMQLLAKDSSALLQGGQTLLQLVGQYGRRLPQLSITDSARFAWRGIMLDVSRHFMSADFIIQLLDEMARYKMNRFHWHLVDGGGWRFPSEKYPLLTKKAAWRTIADWDSWWQHDRRFVDEGTPGAYGGAYTKDDIRRVVAHATRLGITVVPEIELPGHSNELPAAYPELTCKGKWTFDATDVCIGRESTFRFFEDILGEVLELFPSYYIHIGGDEAAMNHWGSCPDCRARMKQEGLKDEHELQSYMIRRIERYLNGKGRQLIGWDEILMGGLAPNAAVMSWRGEEGGITAAKAGHKVVMTPGNYVYLDFYQRESKGEPRAIGGFTPLEKTYSYNPTPAVLSPAEQQYILGVQGNLWTEYVQDEQHAAYMLFPRLLAIAEIGWTPQTERSYPDFLRRVAGQLPALKARGINSYPLKRIAVYSEIDTARREVALRLSSEQPSAEIRYTTDGTMPTASSRLYTGERITSRDSILLVARLFRDGQALDFPEVSYRTDYHLGIGRPIYYNEGCQWNPKYPAGGARALVDGLRGTPTYLDGLWQGFTMPLDVTVDLGETKALRHVFAKFMQEKMQWVYMPHHVELLLSDDGTNWRSLGQRVTTTDEGDFLPSFETFSFPIAERARYVRVKAANQRSAGHFIFLDELVIQ